MLVGLIKITDICDNDCLFCGLKEHGSQHHVPLPTLVDQIGKIRRTGVDELRITGGEPTQHPQIVPFVRSCLQAGFRRIVVYTQGRNLGRNDLAARLVDAGLSSAMVSLFGPDAATHDSIVRAHGSFEETTCGIRSLEAAGVRIVINTTVIEENYRHLGTMLQLVQELAPNRLYWQLSDLFPTSAVMERPALHVAYAESIPFLHGVLNESARNGYGCTTQEFPLCITFPWLKESLELSIGLDLQIVSPGDGPGGVIRVRPWTSLQKTHIEACRDCGMRGACLGVPVSYLQEHSDLSVFKPLTHLDPAGWRA